MQKRRNNLFLFLILFIFILSLCGCKKEEISKIKKEYEDLNGTYREVKLTNDKVFVYINEEELNEKINNNETFVVFYASSKDNYSRSVINIISEVAEYYGLKEVYYVNREEDIPILSGYIDGLLSGNSMCVSGYQTSSDMELTEEMIKDSKEKITFVISPVVTALNSCDIDQGC